MEIKKIELQKIIKIICIVVWAAFFCATYILGGNFGLLLALSNIAGIIFLTYYYLDIIDFFRISLIGISSLFLIVLLYGSSGVNQGPTYLLYMDVIIIAIFIGYKILGSEEFAQRLRETKYNYQTYEVYEPRTCVICGRRLTTRRKYCSYCRPTHRPTPYAYDEDTQDRGIFSSNTIERQPIRSLRPSKTITPRYIGHNLSNVSFEGFVGKKKSQNYYGYNLSGMTFDRAVGKKKKNTRYY